MKNTSNQETAYSLPSLRVVFKKARFQEAHDHISPAANGATEKQTTPAWPDHLPMFDDYKFKAKDHDPL